MYLNIINGEVDLVVHSVFSKENEWVRLKEKHPKAFEFAKHLESLSSANGVNLLGLKENLEELEKPERIKKLKKIMK